MGGSSMAPESEQHADVPWRRVPWRGRAFLDKSGPEEIVSFPSNEICITHISSASEQSPPVAVLRAIVDLILRAMQSPGQSYTSPPQPSPVLSHLLQRVQVPCMAWLCDFFTVRSLHNCNNRQAQFILDLLSLPYPYKVLLGESPECFFLQSS